MNEAIFAPPRSKQYRATIAPYLPHIGGISCLYHPRIEYEKPERHCDDVPGFRRFVCALDGLIDGDRYFMSLE
jgi:hypothetical protein